MEHDQQIWFWFPCSDGATPATPRAASISLPRAETPERPDARYPVDCALRFVDPNLEAKFLRWRFEDFRANTRLGVPALIVFCVMWLSSTFCWGFRNVHCEGSAWVCGGGGGGGDPARGSANCVEISHLDALRPAPSPLTPLRPAPGWSVGPRCCCCCARRSAPRSPVCSRSCSSSSTGGCSRASASGPSWRLAC